MVHQEVFDGPYFNELRVGTTLSAFSRMAQPRMRTVISPSPLHLLQTPAFCSPDPSQEGHVLIRHGKLFTLLVVGDYGSPNTGPLRGPTSPAYAGGVWFASKTVYLARKLFRFPGALIPNPPWLGFQRLKSTEYIPSHSSRFEQKKFCSINVALRACKLALDRFDANSNLHRQMIESQ